MTEGALSTVVKVMLSGAASVSGGSPASTSVMSAAAAVRVQVAVCGRSASGLTVTVDVPEPVTAYGRVGPPQASVKAPEATFTGSLKVSTTFVDDATPTASPTGVEETRAGAASVVNENVRLAGRLSGGSRVSASLMPAAYTVIVQLAPWGSAPVGSSVTVALPDPLMAKGIGVASHVKAKEPAVALTGSLKVTVGLTSVATWVAPSAGLVEVTLGAASLGPDWTCTSSARHCAGPVT